jgi:L-amino acid N-acyltransferase YncA
VSRRPSTVHAVLVRHADPAGDAAACAAIYAPSVTDGVASLEEHAPGEPEMARRIERISSRYPWLVAELDGELAGYAYASEHRARASYRWAADVTVYVSPVHHRRGVGRALYGALLPLLARQGLYVACAGITLPNDASVGLHEALGFELVGVYRAIGFKHGSWRDVGWWQAELTPAVAGRPPAELGPPARLPGNG